MGGIIQWVCDVFPYRLNRADDKVIDWRCTNIKSKYKARIRTLEHRHDKDTGIFTNPKFSNNITKIVNNIPISKTCCLKQQ